MHDAYNRKLTKFAWHSSPGGAHQHLLHPLWSIACGGKCQVGQHSGGMAGSRYIEGRPTCLAGGVQSITHAQINNFYTKYIPTPICDQSNCVSEINEVKSQCIRSTDSIHSINWFTYTTGVSIGRVLIGSRVAEGSHQQKDTFSISIRHRYHIDRISRCRLSIRYLFSKRVCMNICMYLRMWGC